MKSAGKSLTAPVVAPPSPAEIEQQISAKDASDAAENLALEHLAAELMLACDQVSPIDLNAYLSNIVKHALIELLSTGFLNIRYAINGDLGNT